MSDLKGHTSVVVGASRGIGLGVASALSAAGATVVTVSRTEGTGPASSEGPGELIAVTADARDSSVPAQVIGQYQPDSIVVVAGAVPHMSPLTEQTWETFSLAWETDVRITFEWVKEALTKPLAPGSRVVVFSSGAALGGSPLSGGYAGAKGTQRFVTDYASGLSGAKDLGIGFTSIMSKFAPETAVGKAAVAAYSAQAGIPVEKFLKAQEPLLTPELAGTSVAGLLEDEGDLKPAYMLDGSGLHPLPQ